MQPKQSTGKRPANRMRAKSPGNTAPPAGAPSSGEGNAQPRKPGRPTKYEPTMCEQAITLGAEGKSKTQIARTLGISRDSMHEYTKVHSEFSDALKRASDLAQAWWEDEGQAGLRLGKDFNATAFIFQMKNRFRDDYRDKQEIEHEGKPGLQAALVGLWREFNKSAEAKPN